MGRCPEGIADVACEQRGAVRRGIAADKAEGVGSSRAWSRSSDHKKTSCHIIFIELKVQPHIFTPYSVSRLDLERTLLGLE